MLTVFWLTLLSMVYHFIRQRILDSVSLSADKKWIVLYLLQDSAGTGVMIIFSLKASAILCASVLLETNVYS